MTGMGLGFYFLHFLYLKLFIIKNHFIPPKSFYPPKMMTEADVDVLMWNYVQAVLFTKIKAGHRIMCGR